MNLAELGRRNVAEFGEYVALYYEGKEYTNTRTEIEANHFGNGLSELGIRRGDRVIVMLPNCPEVLISYQAILRIGAVIVPVLFLLEARELEHIARDCGAKALLTSPEFLDKALPLKESVPTLQQIIVVGDLEMQGVLKYESLLVGPDDIKMAEMADNETAVTIYTSGTTGTPKGVVLSHHNLYSNAVASVKTQKLTREDTGLNVLPLAHSYGMVVMNSAFLAGISGVLMRWFDAGQAFELIEKYGVRMTTFVPTMITYMLEHPDVDKYKLDTLRLVVCAAAPLSIDTMRAFEERFNCRILEGYGLTEASPTVCINREDMPSKPGSVGPPIDGVEIKIVGDGGEEAPTGEIGEIAIYGPNVMQGYYNLPEQTAQTIRDGWLLTGDMGYVDEDNCLYLVERKKDMIIRGGLNIYPADVEEALCRHDKVMEAAVIGIPDKLMGEKIIAYVVLKGGQEATPEEIMGFAQEQLAKYKTPSQVEFISYLPKNPLGKVLKKELRKMALGEVEEE